jgi:hypothetical protein
MLVHYVRHNIFHEVLLSHNHLMTVTWGNIDRIQSHLYPYWNNYEILDHGLWKYMPRNQCPVQNNSLLRFLFKNFRDILYGKLHQGYSVIGVTSSLQK